jgi:hypothetical protein
MRIPLLRGSDSPRGYGALTEFGLCIQVLWLGQKVDFEFGYSTRLIRAANRGDTVIYVEPFEWYGQERIQGGVSSSLIKNFRLRGPPAFVRTKHTISNRTRCLTQPPRGVGVAGGTTARRRGSPSRCPSP